MTPKESEIKAAQDLWRLIAGTCRWFRRAFLVFAVLAAAYEYVWFRFAEPIRATVVAVKKGQNGLEFAVLEYQIKDEVYRGRIGPGQRGQTRVNVKVGDPYDLLYQPNYPKSWRSARRLRYEIPLLLCFGAAVFWFVPFVAETCMWNQLPPLSPANSESPNKKVNLV